MKILFIDQITFSSLLRVLALGHPFKTIWHFEPTGPFGRRLLRTFCSLGLIRAKVRQIDYHIGQVQNDAGDGEHVKLIDYAKDICSKIKREKLANNPLINKIGSVWEKSKILLYFGKLVEKEVRLECLRIGLVEWMLRTQLCLVPTQCALLIERKQCFSYLEEHARSRGIRLIAYRKLFDPIKIAKAGSRLLLVSRMVLIRLLRAIKGCVRRPVTPIRPQKLLDFHNANRSSAASTLAISYYYRKLSFEPTERSEFFWLNEADIPYSEVLLYGYITDKSLDMKTQEELKARGIMLVGRGPGIPAWVPTRHMFTVLLRTIVKIITSVLACLAHGQWVSSYYVRNLLNLALHYAYWYDFYAANHVRVNISSTFNSHISQSLALDSLNGISASYQYSIVLYPTTLINAGENVQFVFSSASEERLWRSIEMPVEQFVHTGYIYDRAIQAIRGHKNRGGEIRKQLQHSGASYILCYFDENSINRWDIFPSDEEAADEYEYLLKWLIADPTLGIVFKPKRSMNLFQRIARVSDLIGQAMQTGRCQFLTSDTHVDSIFPAEAALSADICIGKLLGCTAALEARLAGVPSVLIDVEGLHSHPFYAWGHNRVVFDNWASLRVAVEHYRATPGAYPEFGDWSPVLNDLDPFRDGQASLRMGLYIRWVYDALKQGASKQTALKMATKKFAQRWGNGHITFG